MVALRYVAGCAETQESIVLDQEIVASQVKAVDGAIGYFDFSGNMDTAIAIRTMVIDGKTIYAPAGAGIVSDEQA